VKIITKVQRVKKPYHKPPSATEPAVKKPYHKPPSATEPAVKKPYHKPPSATEPAVKKPYHKPPSATEPAVKAAIEVAFQAAKTAQLYAKTAQLYADDAVNKVAFVAAEAAVKDPFLYRRNDDRPNVIVTHGHLRYY
jgi:hypothetical protein